MIPFDLGIPTLVFAQRPGTPYRMTLCAAKPGEVATDAGFTVRVTGGLNVARQADTTIVPGYTTDARPAPAVLEVLARAHDQGKRIVSICTGAFALALPHSLRCRASSPGTVIGGPFSRRAAT